MKCIIHFHFKPKNNIGDMAVILGIKQLVEESVGKVRWTSKILKELRYTDTAKLLNTIHKHDLMIVGGGGFYSSWALPLNDELISQIKIPIVIFGAGYNSNYGEKPLTAQQIDSIKILNSKASACAVRDIETQKFLKQLGFESIVTGDPALWIKSKKTWAVGKHTPRIGINMATHGWALQDEYLDKLIHIYQETLSQLPFAQTAQLYYLAHTNTKAENQLIKKLTGL